MEAGGLHHRMVVALCALAADPVEAPHNRR
jgi:hypothetical protein